MPASNPKYIVEMAIQPNIPSILSNSGSNSMIPTVQVKNITAKNIMNSLRSCVTNFLSLFSKSIPLFH